MALRLYRSGPVEDEAPTTLKGSARHGTCGCVVAGALSSRTPMLGLIRAREHDVSENEVKGGRSTLTINHASDGRNPVETTRLVTLSSL